jgi:hypothetical protein
MTYDITYATIPGSGAPMDKIDEGADNGMLSDLRNALEEAG